MNFENVESQGRHGEAQAYKRAARKAAGRRFIDWVKPYIGPSAFFAAVSILMTRPLAANMSHAVIGPRGQDNWYYVWLIGWFQKALFELGQNPLVVPMHHFPVGWRLAYSEITLANVIPALPVSLLGGPVLAYNLVTLLSFILSGLFVYGWVASLTHNRPAGLVSGALFAFAPYRLAHLYGHLPLLGTQYLALHYAGLYFLLRQPKLNWKYAAWAGIGLGLASLSSMYYLYMTLVVSAVFIGGYIFFSERRACLRPAFWKNLLALALVALPLLLLAIGPYLQLSLLGEANHRPAEEVAIWSASLPDFFLPAPVHFLWGSWVAANFDRTLWIEQTLYLGAAALFLTACAILGRRKMAPETARTANLLLFCMATAAILAMGQTLHWFREEVVVNVPEYLQGLLGRSDSPVYLPNYLLFRLLPFYDGMRAWMRYGIYAGLFGSVLAGFGLATFLGGIKRRSMAALIPAFLLILIGIDFNIAPFPLSEVQARPVDHWLAAQPGEGAVVQFPIELSIQPEQVYATLVHQKPFLGMFSGAYLPSDFERIYKKLKRFPTRVSLELVRERGAEYILVDAYKYPDWEETRQQLLAYGLVEVAIVDKQHVFRFGSP